jgi:hypothetical protein
MTIFTVKQVKVGRQKKLRINWNVQALCGGSRTNHRCDNLADYLVWAFNEYAVRYKVSACCELCYVSGNAFGEYSDGLFWDGFEMYRLFNSTHYLTQHGLDLLPTVVWTQYYYSGEQIFRVEADGVFSMSMREWMRYFCSGRNERSLDGLAVSEDTIRGTQEELRWLA